MILLDLNGLFYMNVTSIPNDEYSLDNLRKSLLKSIFFLNNEFKKDYGQMVICKDSKKNWRKEIFEPYKAKRSEKRAEDDRDWKTIFNHLDIIMEEIRENIPFIVLEIEGLEADDLIALCARGLKKDQKHIILSSDKDMMQLLSDVNISQYSLLNREMIIYDKTKLKELIIKGDASDGVPNIYSTDNIFLMEGVRQRSISSLLLEEVPIDSEENFKKYFENEYDVTMEKDKKKKDEDKKIKVSKEVYVNEILNHFKRNKTLVDLSQIPEKFIPIFKSEFIAGVNRSKEASTKTRNYTTKHYLSSFYFNEFQREIKGVRIEE